MRKSKKVYEMKKRIQQLHRKLSKIAMTGMNGFAEYKSLISDVIRNGEINVLIALFETKYRVELKDITQTKLKSLELYNIVRFNTTSKIVEDIDEIFNKARLTYVNNIVYDRNNIEIGIVKEETNFLNVHKISTMEDIEIKFDEDGLLNAYKSAITFLK